MKIFIFLSFCFASLVNIIIFIIGLVLSRILIPGRFFLDGNVTYFIINIILFISFFVATMTLILVMKQSLIRSFFIELISLLLFILMYWFLEQGDRQSGTSPNYYRIFNITVEFLLGSLLAIVTGFYHCSWLVV